MSSLKWATMILVALLFFSCKSEYDQLVRKELSTGVQNDSLIFNMHVGQTKKDFYEICWELNSQKILSQGSGNQYARYDEPAEGLEDPTKRKRMDFFGIFDENGVMQGMEMIFNYIAWAPWNEDLQASNLEEALIKEFEAKYPGNDFIDVDLKGLDKKAYVKVDGNRQILLYARNNTEVLVRIEDLNHKLQLK